MTHHQPVPADVVAAAIVASCRETGEDPLRYADRSPEQRFRHYALHALIAVYESDRRVEFSSILAAPGKPSYFYRSSLWHVLGHGPAGDKPASWWDKESFARVVRATFDELRKVSPIWPPQQIEAEAKTMPESVPRPAPTETPQTPSCAKFAAPIAVRRQPEENVKMDGKVAPSRILEWNGVTLDLKERKVKHGAKEAVATDDGIRLVAALARVMPAFLPIDIIAKKVTGRVDAVELLRDVVSAANAALRGIDLEVRLVPKMGYMLADLTA